MAPQPEVRIGERLRFYRQAKGKTQAVVAGLAGVTEDYLSQIERGLKTPTRSCATCRTPRSSKRTNRKAPRRKHEKNDRVAHVWHAGARHPGNKPCSNTEKHR